MLIVALAVSAVALLLYAAQQFAPRAWLQPAFQELVRPRLTAMTRWPYALRSPRPLVVLGIAIELILLLYFVRLFPLVDLFDHGSVPGISGHTPLMFATFLGVCILLFGLLVLAMWHAHHVDDGTGLWLVLGFGALFALTMTFVYPETATDVFTYVDQSVILVQYHQNPIFTPPAQYPNDPLMTYAASWAGTGAPYGPLGIIIDALPTLVCGRHFLASVILLKLMFSTMVLISGVIIYHLLKRTDSPWALSGVLLVVWNPLILFETAANGHNDIAMMLLVVLGALMLARHHLVWGLLLVVASVLVKYATLPLIPLVLIYGITHQPSHWKRLDYLARSLVATAAIVVASYAPFWHGTATFSRSLLENSIHIESFSSVVADIYAANFTIDQATLLGRILFVPVFMYALWLSTRRLVDLWSGCYLTMFSFVILASSNFKIWYTVWPVILAALVPRLSYRLAVGLMACGTTLSAAFYDYMWGLPGLGFSVANRLSYLVSFVPAALIVLGTLVWQAIRYQRTTSFRLRVPVSRRGHP